MIEDDVRANNANSLIDNIEKAVAYANDRLERLSLRIEPILASEGCEDVAGCVSPSMSSALSQRLDGVLGRVCSLGSRLNDIGDRVDL